MIELLVVVAIIALLISILLPSLSKARAVARTVKCSAILKQYGVGNEMYANAWEGIYAPPWARRAAMRWYRNMSFRQMMGMSSTKWESVDGLLCPSAPEEEFINTEHQLTRGKNPRAHWDHVYAQQIYGIVFGATRTAEDGIFIRRSWITHPADKFNFVDATNYEVGGASRINGTQWLMSGDRSASRGSGGSSHIAYRHDVMGINALHRDGHVEFYHFADAWPSSLVGQERHWLVYSSTHQAVSQRR